MSTDPVRPEEFTACFAVRAAAEPGTLPRLIEVFSKRGFVLGAVQARTHGGVSPVMAVDIQIDGIGRGLAETMAESLRQVVGVERVLLTALAEAAAA